jgi:replicative DNA helicase
MGLSDDPDDLARTEVIFAKNRNGQVGSVEMRYVGDLMKFEDEQPFYQSDEFVQTDFPV